MPRSNALRPPVRPGRPAKDAGDAAPTHRILDAATRLFLENGYEVVSTEALAKTAQVSKSTIYRHFGDMAGVLKAVVIRAGDAFNAGVESAPKSREALKGALVAYGRNLLELLNLDYCRQLDQMLHEQARRHPETARAFYDSAYGRSHRDVTHLLEQAQAHGVVDLTTSPGILADNLISMWEGLAYVRARLGLENKPFPDPNGWSQHCVDMLFPGQPKR